MRLALFGGTFDPVHCGHLEIARKAADAFDLDQVWLIASGRPPHKTDRRQADYEQRHRMVELACESDPRFVASRLEAPDAAGEDKTYSIDTIERVRSGLQPKDRLFFLLGEDAFADLAIWRRLDDVVRLAEFIVAARPDGGRERAPRVKGLRAHWLDSTANPVSATEVRQRVAAGEDLQGWLPDAVAAYVESQGLYR